MFRRKTLAVLLWLAALMLFGTILGRLPLAAITQTITMLSAGDWLVWIGLNLGIMLLATQRWRLFTTMLDLPVSLGELLMIRQAGQAVSFITPGPQFGGEPLQIYWLWKRRSLAIHRAVLALGLDRFYELWVNFGVLSLGVGLLLISPAGDVGGWQHVLPILVSLMLVAALLGWLVLRRPGWVLARLRGLGRQSQHHPRLERLEAHWQRLRGDLRSIPAARKFVLWPAFMLSLLGWVGLIAELWLLLSIFDLALDLSAFLLIGVAMRMAFLLPLPAGIGTLEAAVFWAFQYLDLPGASAMGLIALMRLRDAVILLFGLSCLRVLHVRD